MKKITVNKTTVAFIHEGTSVLDDKAFSSLSIADKTKVMSEIIPPFLYVETFSSLSDLKVLKQKLLNGEDCSIELAYNGLTAPADLSRVRNLYLETVAPVLAAIEAIKPVYPFAEYKTLPKVTTDGTYAIRDSHRIKLTTLQKVWKRASPLWAKHWLDTNLDKNGNRKNWRSPESVYINGSDIAPSAAGRYFEIKSGHVSIGCQTITRQELEQFALSQGWEFPAI